MQLWRRVEHRAGKFENIEAALAWELHQRRFLPCSTVPTSPILDTIPEKRIPIRDRSVRSDDGFSSLGCVGVNRLSVVVFKARRRDPKCGTLICGV